MPPASEAAAELLPLRVPPRSTHQTHARSGLLPPLDAPHHMRASEWGPYREGLVLRSQPGSGSYVDIGAWLCAVNHGP